MEHSSTARISHQSTIILPSSRFKAGIDSVVFHKSVFYTLGCSLLPDSPSCAMCLDMSHDQNMQFLTPEEDSRRVALA